MEEDLVGLTNTRRGRPVRSAVRMMDTIFDLVPELGQALKDGQLTPEETASIQVKLDKITDLLHKIRHTFK